MQRGKLVILITFLSAVFNGCVSNPFCESSREINADAVQAIFGNPEGLMALPIALNQRIKVFTKLGISQGMLVTNIDRETIWGKEVTSPGQKLTSKDVEIKLEEIESISVGGCGAGPDTVQTIKLDIPFEYDSFRRLPINVGLYFPPDNESCDTSVFRDPLIGGFRYYGISFVGDEKFGGAVGGARGTVAHADYFFSVSEISTKFWPNVFKTQFSDVRVLQNKEKESQRSPEITVEVRCEGFLYHRDRPLPVTFGPKGYIHNPDTEGGVNMQVEYRLIFSCPDGMNIGTHTISGYAEHLYQEGPVNIAEQLPHATFQSAGRKFVGEIMPKIEAYVQMCRG